MFVILNPTPVILKERSDRRISLRVNSLKNLIISSESIIEILRLTPQNDNELPRRKQRGIKWNILNFLAASGGELTPERLDGSCWSLG